jgi:hypothetical protein
MWAILFLALVTEKIINHKKTQMAFCLVWFHVSESYRNAWELSYPHLRNVFGVREYPGVKILGRPWRDSCLASCWCQVERDGMVYLIFFFIQDIFFWYHRNVSSSYHFGFRRIPQFLPCSVMVNDLGNLPLSSQCCSLPVLLQCCSPVTLLGFVPISQTAIIHLSI